MRQRWLSLLKICLVWVLVLLPFSGGHPSPLAEEPGTVLRISPAARTAAVGEVFTVEIWVDDVLDLYGADIRLAFDPDAFEVVGEQIVIKSDLLQPDFIIGNEVDNTAGKIIYGVTQMNPTPPADGSGVLFEFQLRTKKPGVYSLYFTNHQLSDKADAYPIPHTIQEPLYTIEGDPMHYWIYLPLIRR